MNEQNHTSQRNKTTTTVIVLAIIAILFSILNSGVTPIDSEYLDTLCDQDGSFLQRISGYWGCGTSQPSNNGGGSANSGYLNHFDTCGESTCGYIIHSDQ